MEIGEKLRLQGEDDGSYQRVNEVISLELERFHGMKNVDLAVNGHLLTDDPASTEQSTLAGSIDAVHDHRCSVRGGALCRTTLHYFHQLHESVS